MGVHTHSNFQLAGLFKGAATSAEQPEHVALGLGVCPEILEYCEPDKCISKEQFYLDLYSHTFGEKYNILKKAGSSLGFKHSAETLAKLKLRKFSEETLKKLRLHISNLNLELNIKKRIKVNIHDFITGSTTTYDSVAIAAKSINSHSKTLLEKEKYDLESKDIIPFPPSLFKGGLRHPKGGGLEDML